MKKEVIVTAKTIEDAVAQGAEMLSVSRDDVTYEVLELPKKGMMFGLGERDAKVKVVAEVGRADAAVSFINKILSFMSLTASVKVTHEDAEEIRVDVTGEGLGSLIGYHGEALDALQYLTTLAVNRGEGQRDDGEGAVRVTVDVGGYRAKREESLSTLAKRVADKVLRFGKPVTLEPMNAYERRVIHSTVQNIRGVTTYSIGQDNDRRIVVNKEGAARPAESEGRSGAFRDGNAIRTRPSPRKPERRAKAFPEDEE